MSKEEMLKIIKELEEEGYEVHVPRVGWRKAILSEELKSKIEENK